MREQGECASCTGIRRQLERLEELEQLPMATVRSKIKAASGQVSLLLAAAPRVVSKQEAALRKKLERVREQEWKQERRFTCATRTSLKSEEKCCLETLR